jgi:NAD(P)H-flavin reductase
MMSGCSTETKKDIYLPMPATVKKSRMMNGTEMYLHITPDDRRLEYQPGQFVEVSIPGFGEAPITISSSPTMCDGFEIVVRRIGTVTNMIHKLKAGDKVGIRGPLGKGYYPVEKAKGKDLVFVCGGIGLVPQRSFINYVLDNRNDYGRLTVLLGTKCSSQRFFHSEIAAWKHREDMVFLETVDQAEDCWRGDVGVVTTLIPRVRSDLERSLVFVCGPPVMYRFVLLALAGEKVAGENIYLNLERRMKCGVGKCGHCQINDKYACMDGPVFCYSDLKTVPEAI